MKYLSLVLFLLLSLLYGMAITQNNDLEILILQSVSPTKLQKHVHKLVEFGPRLGGTPSGDIAANYVLAEFKKAGLASHVIIDPAELTYEAKSWQLRVVSPGSRILKNAWPYKFSPSTKIQGKLIYLDKLTPKILQTHNLKDKILFTDDEINAGIYKNLLEQKVQGVITDFPNKPGVYQDWSFIGSLPQDRNTLPVLAISYNEGQWLKKQLAKKHKIAVHLELDSKIFYGSPRTVIAEITGRESQKYYIYCAHGDSDSSGPGADDNASGVATVLETARILNELIQQGKLPPPRFTIKFIVWGSEYYSAQNYVSRHQSELDKILGVLNFDEVGTGTLRKAIYFESNEVPWNKNLLRTLDDIGARYCGKNGFWREYTTNPSQGGTDSYMFLPEKYFGQLKFEAKIPATTIYTAAWGFPNYLNQTPGWHSPCWSGKNKLEIDFSKYYHSSGDLPENTTDLEPWRMVWAVKAGALALLHLAW
ncbi:MAG: M28 family peptidase [Calditrichaeota bacterium]|nr:MAG: M28 family peptidase [Calditrichota bacterium]